MKEEISHQENSNKISFDINKYEIKITPDLTIKDIKDQLINNYNISLDEFDLYCKYVYLSEGYDDRLLNSFFEINEKRKLYLYHKNDFYEIDVKYRFSHYKLEIHDSMLLGNITMMFDRKYRLNSSKYKYRPSDFIIDGIETYREKEAAFYNLRKAKSIVLNYIILKG